MIHPIPPGTRDILPDEMRELRRLSRALIEVFEERGYGEVATPAIEYDEVLARGGARGASDSAYRFFDESGELLALRSDMTVPIARLVASRFAGAEPPLRLCYLASAYRAVRPQRGQMREFVQAGVELIGAPAPEGTVEVIEVLEAALDAAGLDRAVIGLGDADLFRQLLDGAGRRGGRPAIRSWGASPRTTWSASRPSSPRSPGLGEEQIATCVALAQMRGGSRGAGAGARPRRRGGRARDRPDAEHLRGARAPRRRRSRPDRPRPAARPRLLQRRDPRGLRPRPGSHHRRRRPLRRTCCGASASTCRRPASRSTSSASTSPRWRRNRVGGRARERRRRPRQARRAAEAGGAARRAASRKRSTSSTRSASTLPVLAATRAR